jgi:hypothetical protein
MKQLFLDILTQLQTLTFSSNGITITPFIGVWNNQLKAWNNGKLYDVQKPALFIEFVSGEVLLLSEGVEVFDPLDIKIHIIDNLLDAGDGTQEQNLRIFDFKQQVYLLLKQFQPDNCIKFFRVSETQDYDHDNLYHYIQTYRTTYTDYSAQLPINAITKEPPTPLTVMPDA